MHFFEDFRSLCLQQNVEINCNTANSTQDCTQTVVGQYLENYTLPFLVHMIALIISPCSKSAVCLYSLQSFSCLVFCLLFIVYIFCLLFSVYCAMIAATCTYIEDRLRCLPQVILLNSIPLDDSASSILYVRAPDEPAAIGPGFGSEPIATSPV